MSTETDPSFRISQKMNTFLIVDIDVIFGEIVLQNMFFFIRDFGCAMLKVK